MSDRDAPPSLFRTGDPALGSVAASFDPARLTQARQAAGMTKAKLAAEIKVTPAAVGQYEAQVVTPRCELLPELARALQVPVDYFAAGRPLGRVDGAQAHFRSLRTTAARDRAKAVAFIEQVWELTFALEKRVRFPDVDLPAIDTHFADPAAAAQGLRARWGLGSLSLIHI